MCLVPRARLAGSSPRALQPLGSSPRGGRGRAEGTEAAGRDAAVPGGAQRGSGVSGTGLEAGGKRRQQEEIVKLEVQICFLPCVKTFSEDKITSQSGHGPRARWHLLQPGCQVRGSRPGAGRSRSCVQAAGSRCCHAEPHVPGLKWGLPGCPCLHGFGKGPSERSAARARGAEGGAARVGLAPKGRAWEPRFRGFPACCAMGWEPHGLRQWLPELGRNRLKGNACQ